MTGPLTEIDLRRLGPDFALPMAIEHAGHFALTEHGEEFLRILREQVRPLATPAAL